MKRTNIMLTENQHKTIKAFARKEGKTLGNMVREALDVVYKKKDILERRKQTALNAYGEGLIGLPLHNPWPLPRHILHHGFRLRRNPQGHPGRPRRAYGNSRSGQNRPADGSIVSFAQRKDPFRILLDIARPWRGIEPCRRGLSRISFCLG